MSFFEKPHESALTFSVKSNEHIYETDLTEGICRAYSVSAEDVPKNFIPILKPKKDNLHIPNFSDLKTNSYSVEKKKVKFADDCLEVEKNRNHSSSRPFRRIKTSDSEPEDERNKKEKSLFCSSKKTILMKLIKKNSKKL